MCLKIGRMNCIIITRKCAVSDNVIITSFLFIFIFLYTTRPDGISYVREQSLTRNFGCLIECNGKWRKLKMDIIH